jgi:hypothetical protein
MADAAVTVSAPALTAYIVSVLEALEMSPKNAAISADLMGSAPICAGWKATGWAISLWRRATRSIF